MVRFRGSPNKVPTWIVVDNESESLLQTPERERSSSRRRRSTSRMDRDALIQEVLDGRPNHRYEFSSSFEDPPLLEQSPSQEGSKSLTLTTATSSSTSVTPPPSSSQRAKRMAAPFVSCLQSSTKCTAANNNNTTPTAAAAYDDGQRHAIPMQEVTTSNPNIGSDEILQDLNRDPRLTDPWVTQMPDYLRFGVVLVQGASMESVNGVYRCTNQVDSVGHYTKSGTFRQNGKRKKVVFSIFRCIHGDNSRRWYLSICSKHHEPGTKHDYDLYAAMATSKQTPPSNGWRVVVGSGIPGKAICTMWIPHEARLDTCHVCQEAPVSHVVVPCGHACLCATCAKHAATCPEGNCKVESVIRLFGTVEPSKTTQSSVDDVYSARIPQLETPLAGDFMQPQVLPVTHQGFRRVVL